MVDNGHKNVIGRNLLKIRQKGRRNDTGQSHLTDEQWTDTGKCSKFEVENLISAKNAKTYERQAQMQDNDNRLVCPEGSSRTSPKTEKSIQVKIVGKINAYCRQKGNLGNSTKRLFPEAQLVK